jgi:hypothetical protein
MAFPTTRWGLILASRQGADARREALDVLFTAYWKPLYFYLRRKGLRVCSRGAGSRASISGRDRKARAGPAVCDSCSSRRTYGGW